MEIAFAVVGATDVAVRATSKLWALSTAWRDAPTDLHNLRDDLACTERFFGEVQQHLHISRSQISSPIRTKSFTFGDSDVSPFPRSPFLGSEFGSPTMGAQSELGRLVDQGSVALRRIEAIIDNLAGTADADAETQSVLEKMGELSKRRKFLWLRQSRKIAKLRKELGHIRSGICRALIAQNISISSEIYNTLEQSQLEVSSQLSTISMSIDASQDTLITQLDGRLQGIEDRMIAAIRQTPSEKAFTPTSHLIPYSPPPPYSPSLTPTVCNCPCPCHTPTTQTYHLAFLRSLFGILLVAHSNRQSTRCTNPACLSSTSPPKSSQSINLTYHLPSWLARTTLSALYTTTPTPALNLRVYYRRPITETQAAMGASRLIEKGDIPALKGELAAGRISIYDIHAKRGHTALSVAIHACRPEAAKLYLAAGADPFFKDDFGDMVITTAFMLAISGAPAEKKMGELFPIGRYVEEADFTALMRGVLCGVDISGMLAKMDRRGMEEQRGEGWTALHLAAIKGDAKAVRALVRAGADVDAKTGRHSVMPLYYACRYGHEEVVRVLLTSGADVNLRDCYGRQPIHSSVGTVAKVNIVRMLLRHGADVNSPGMQGYPPLMYAVLWGTIEAVEFLVENGADMTARSVFGETMLMMAVRVLRHDSARWLSARAEASLFQCVDEDERNLLHFIGRGGDEEMMDIFTGTEKWRGVGVLAKDKYGLTPLYLLNQRDPDKGLREAFDRLLDWVEKCNDDCEDASDDEFFDAEEGSITEG
ncbi:hypothetical protein OQA88_11832 [Cercophora sp. LCS_1]